jgi:predicted Mrr-cat superfamily restriction endonuclease
MPQRSEPTATASQASEPKASGAVAVPADQLWVVHMSHHSVVERGLKEGFICVGWVEAGDMRQYPTREALKVAFDRHYPGRNPQLIAHWAGDALRFLFEMSKGDLFVFPVTGGQEIHVGQVDGDYEFADHDAELKNNDSASIRKVRWLATVRRSAFTPAAIRSFDSEHTVHSGRAHVAEVKAILAGKLSH